MDKLKLGMIGVGGIAQNRHIPAFKQLKGTAQIVGVHDINYDLAQQVAKEHMIPHVFIEYEEMFNEIDAVVICTQNKFHKEISIEAINAGVHVFCEKRMAMIKERSNEMMETYKTEEK